MILLLPGLETKTTLTSGTTSLPGDCSLQGDSWGSVSTDLTTSFNAHVTQILSLNWDWFSLWSVKLMGLSYLNPKAEKQASPSSLVKSSKGGRKWIYCMNALCYTFVLISSFFVFSIKLSTTPTVVHLNLNPYPSGSFLMNGRWEGGGATVVRVGEEGLCEGKRMGR